MIFMRKKSSFLPKWIIRHKQDLLMDRSLSYKTLLNSRFIQWPWWIERNRYIIKCNHFKPYHCWSVWYLSFDPICRTVSNATKKLVEVQDRVKSPEKDIGKLRNPINLKLCGFRIYWSINACHYLCWFPEKIYYHTLGILFFFKNLCRLGTLK